ncbi:MAG: hypothetical protein AB8B91_14720, partial [Rubripirellula sp.]
MRTLEKHLRWDVYIIAALMTLVTFSLPGREGPSGSGGMDLLGLAKFAIRVGSAGWLGIAIIYFFNRAFDAPKKQLSLRSLASWCPWLLVPWLVYAVWAGLSISWSPLRTFSMGQWFGLIAVILFSMRIATRTSDKHSATNTNERPTELMVFVNSMLMIYCIGVLAVYCVSPLASGLDRQVLLQGTT